MAAFPFAFSALCAIMLCWSIGIAGFLLPLTVGLGYTLLFFAVYPVLRRLGAIAPEPPQEATPTQDERTAAAGGPPE